MNIRELVAQPTGYVCTTSTRGRSLKTEDYALKFFERPLPDATAGHVDVGVSKVVFLLLNQLRSRSWERLITS